MPNENSGLIELPASESAPSAVAESPTLGESARRLLPYLALVAVLLLGAVLRFVGINWDDYQHLHPDERFLTMVETGIEIPGTPDISGKLPPGCSEWGGYFDTACSPLSPYNRGFNSFVYGTFPLFLVKYVGAFVGQSGYDQVFLVGRYASGLFDLFSVLLVFLIGRRLYGVWAGLIASLLAAASVLNIQQSHFFTVDTFANVPLLIAFWFTLDIMQGRRGWLAYALAGIFFGLSLAARINLLPFAAIIALASFYRFAHLFRVRWDRRPLDSPAETRVLAVEMQSPDSLPDATSRQVRSWSLGPLSIEVTAEREPRLTAAGESEGETRPQRMWWESAAIIGFQLALSALLAVLAFRVTQPYAFSGWGLNPQFLADMDYARNLIAGQYDVPPMHQWTARPDYWFPYVNMVLWGLGPGLGILGTAGFVLAGIELVLRRRWMHLLGFFWVGGLFLYMGQQVAKTDRYYLPLYPFIALFAAYMVVRLWRWAFRTRASFAERTDARPKIPRAMRQALAMVVILAGVGYTLFWAAAFTSIYTRPVSRITASEWIYNNIPKGSVLGNEHWDDPLPLRIGGRDAFGGWYKGVELQWYGEDTPEKRDQAIGWLDEADYIILSSNRLYLSIPRLPLRYPMTVKYYDALFDGSLGFSLVQTVTSRPEFLGIQINDDDAEESFTVYDHPKVLIFKKNASYSRDKVAALFNSVDLTDVIRQKPLDATESHNAFQLDPVALQAEYSGGTWGELFNPADVVNQLPVPFWLLFLELLGIVMAPYTFVVFRRFVDRGYAFAKACGVLALAWGAWTLASYHLIAFSQESILLVLGLLTAGALVVAWRHAREIAAFLRNSWRVLLVEEAIFFAFFFLSLLIRYGNPDLWHPAFGGEKPMDFAYLNAIIKTTWFPPYNPWFEGGYINYYYFGQVMSATLVKVIGIVPEVAYNLLLPMFFSLTALGAFGVVSNLVGAILNGNSARVGIAGARPSRLRPWLAGLFAAFLVLIIGNLGEIGVLYGALTKMGGGGGLVALLAGIAEWAQGRPFPIAIGDWYWTATRVIPETINEFPFFTFLYADLHAHLMSLAFTLVSLGLAIHAVLLRGRLRWYDLGAAALVLGALRPTNTWDFPTYLAAVGAAIVIGQFGERSETGETKDKFSWLAYLSFGVFIFIQVMLAVIPINALGVKITIDVLIYGLVIAFGLILGWLTHGLNLDPRRVSWSIGWRMIALVMLAALFYYPFLDFYGAAYTSVEIWKGQRSDLMGFLTVWGIFLFMAGTFLVLANLSRRAAPQVKVNDDETPNGAWLYVLAAIIVFALVMIVLNLVVFAVVIPLVVLAAWLFLREESTPEVKLLTLLAATALMLTAMVEVITLKGDVGRMNTVFKFYLQAWVILSVVSATGLAIIWDQLWPSRARARAEAATAETQGLEPGAAEKRPEYEWRQAWWGALAVLLAIGLLYPIFATWAKVNDRYVAGSPPGLNGMDYMLGASYGENGHDFQLAPDHAAIEWIRTHLQGSPVIVEANTGLYRWGDRISINTGLPTVIGWDWHTKQQYALLDGAIIDQRLAELRTFYNDADPLGVLPFIRRYHVSYIYVGPLERAVYEPTGLSKFEAMASAGLLNKVYDTDGVQIYQVNQTALARSN